jgi:hypothetical protein
LKAFPQLVACPQGGTDVAQRIGVVAEVRAHGRRQREVLRRGARVAGTGEGETEPELGIIVARTSVDNAAEVSSRCCILAGVELRARERLEYAPGPRLGCGCALEQLGRRSGAAPAEQVEAAPVELVCIRTGRRVRTTRWVSTARWVATACWRRVSSRIWSIL